MCSHCGKSCHLIDADYKKHKYPPSFKRRNSNINNYTTEDELNDNYNVMSHKEKSENFGLMFTHKQHKVIMGLIQ